MVPVIILNLQPVAVIDYERFNALGNRTQMTGDWLAHCAACPVPEIDNAFNRARIDFHQVTGVLSPDTEFWWEIEDWIEAARTAVALDKLVEQKDLGSMAYYYMGTGIDEQEDLIDLCHPWQLAANGPCIPIAGEYEVKNAQILTSPAEI